MINSPQILRRAFLIFSIHFVVGAAILQSQGWVKVTPTFDPQGIYNTSSGYFVDSSHGWWTELYPGTAWYTDNAGETFSKILDSGKVWFYNITFADIQHGWIVGQTLPPDHKYFMLSTQNGGASWSKHSIPALSCLNFWDSLNGFAGGDDTIYTTTDGGITWTPVQIHPNASFGITDIFFVDKNNGWAVGGSSEFWDAGIILNTIDGGKHWEVKVHPAPGVYSKVHFTDSLNGYIVGSSVGSFGGSVNVTHDGGVTWKLHDLGTWLYDIDFTNDSTGWAVGEAGYIWKTTNRGLNWSKVESGATTILRQIFFFDHGNVGYILGDHQTFLEYNSTVGVNKKHPASEPPFHLSQNYPNPFNPTTTIEYSIPSSASVSLIVFDLLGRTVAILVNQKENAGSHYVNFIGTSLPSGIYLYQLQTVNFVTVKKFILLK